jgi:hypothetical protein
MTKAITWRRWAAAAALGLALALLAAGAAAGSRAIAGNLIVDFHVDSAPHRLPRLEDAPIRFWGSIELHTKDGSTPPPLKHLTVEADRFGHLETRGLPVCSRQKLVATTTAQARGICPGAIVGSGRGSGVIEFPEQAPIPASSPVTFFNGPEVDGDPTVIVHAHLDVPAPTTYLVPVRIETIHKGIYGFRIEGDIPPIAGGYGSITDFRFDIDRKWSYRGEKLSYVYARCQIGRLQAFFTTLFVDGTELHSHFVHPCQVR